MIIAIAAFAVLTGGAVAYKLQSNSKPALPAAAPTQAEVRPAPAQPVPSMELAAAISERKVKAEFKTNGREKLRAQFTNATAEAIELRLPAGQLFQSTDSTVVLLREGKVELKGNQTATADFETAATASTNKVAIRTCAPVAGALPKLAVLISHFAGHPEISVSAMQTAVLAVTENLPVSSFAKFSQPGTDLPSQFDTTAFKVDTRDIVGALIALREAGVPDAQLALTIDPLLKIEAMIDPLAHAAAMKYYGITAQTEWEYWKRELLAGDQATRHYALFGIARYYPEVALQMLPTWVREARTSAVYRTSAVQALAETQRTEALSVLRQLEFELSSQTELAATIRTAADFLDARLNKATANSKAPVQFRISKDLPKQAALTTTSATIAATN